MSTYDLIKQAIKNKQQVFGTYHGYHREMCPHTLGYGKDGNQQALFYQFGGQSKTGLGLPGSPENWRCIKLNELTNVSVHDGNWHTAPDHSRPQTCVHSVDIEVRH